MADNYFEIRREKLDSYTNNRPPRYPGKFDKTHTCAEVKQLADGLSNIGSAGRVMSLRVMGKLTFGQIQDHTGRSQFSMEATKLGQEEYDFLLKHIDIGDYIGISGETYTTRKGEKTVNGLSVKLLSKCLRPLPEKWHGLSDPELRARQRYLDLISNEDTRKRFEARHKVLKHIRKTLDDNGFWEVETPILQAAACGAAARPFVTHHNALDMPLYLRIAPETYLKRLVTGGYERVYEIGKCFRNEGIDASHLQEFTMLEWYAAYWDFRDNMRFVQKLIQGMVQEACGSLKISYQGQEIDFSGDWPEITYRDLILRDTGIDLDKVTTLEALVAAAKAKGLELGLEKGAGYGKAVDTMYKRYSRPKLIQPCFITMHPEALVPLARKNDANPGTLDMFQVLVNSWELVKAYSELVDPIEQRTRLMDQAKLAAAGDDETMMLEEDFIYCMEHGMPPMSGLGLGIDRMLALLTDSKNIRDVIYFPSLRAAEAGDETPAAAEEAPKHGDKK